MVPYQHTLGEPTGHLALERVTRLYKAISVPFLYKFFAFFFENSNIFLTFAVKKLQTPLTAMNKREKFVITINREVGSGGRTVGEKLAAKLSVPFYDKALIKALESKYNLTVEEIESLKGRSHSWWSDFKRAIGLGYAMSNNPDLKYSVLHEPDLLTTDDIFKTELEILKGIAETESCVVAGRSGFHVFHNHPNHLSILIQAPLNQRVQRVARKRGISEEEARETIVRVDEMRENYVQKYTGKSRYDTRNYDLVVNSAGKTEEEIANIIYQYIG